MLDINQSILDLLNKVVKEVDLEKRLIINKEIKQILLDHIKSNPNNINVRLKLIKHVYSTNSGDVLDVIDYINELLQYDPYNIYALLYLAYIQRFDLFEMDDQLINKLKEYKSSDNEIMAIIAIGISWYYDIIYLKTKDKEYLENQEKWLKKSIQYNGNIVRNYWELIVLYLEHGKSELTKSLIPLALNNIQHIFNENYAKDEYLFDTTNVEEFFNICYKKIHVSQSFVDELISWQNLE